MTKYFNNVSDLQELRKQYRDLLKKYHPDNGGSEEITKAINAEYDNLFKILKAIHKTKSADSNQNDTKADYNANMYDWENDKALREVLQRIIKFDGIVIEIIGTWLWISGNTYNYKKELKEIGFRWASQKKMWYWKMGDYQKKSHKTLSMNDIRNYYGSVKVQTEQLRAIEA